MDPTFAPFVAWARGNDVPVSLVSDGFGLYIEPLLADAGIGDVAVVHERVGRGDDRLPERPSGLPQLWDLQDAGGAARPRAGGVHRRRAVGPRTARSTPTSSSRRTRWSASVATTACPSCRGRTSTTCAPGWRERTICRGRWRRYAAPDGCLAEHTAGGPRGPAADDRGRGRGDRDDQRVRGARLGPADVGARRPPLRCRHRRVRPRPRLGRRVRRGPAGGVGDARAPALRLGRRPPRCPRTRRGHVAPALARGPRTRDRQRPRGSDDRRPTDGDGRASSGHTGTRRGTPRGSCGWTTPTSRRRRRSPSGSRSAPTGPATRTRRSRCSRRRSPSSRTGSRPRSPRGRR